jgi:hypothetical protein
MTTKEILRRLNNKLNYIILLQEYNNYTSDANIKRILRMSKEMDDIVAQVKVNNDAIDSAVVLINGIADRIAAAGTDGVALAALTAELKAKDDVLATAVVANTPVVTPPTEPVV